jgi:amino acid permease
MRLKNMQTLSQKGVAHPFLSLVMSFFILIGVWYVYKSYEQKQVMKNFSQIYCDYKTWALTVVKDAKDRERVEGLFREINGIVAKYQTGTKALPSYPDTKAR